MRRTHATAVGILVGLGLLGLGLIASGAATAQTVIPGGENGEWKAYTFKKNGVTVCYMASAPKKSVGEYAKRDAVYALVTNDPTTNARGEVSFVAGYAFKKDSTVGVTIGGKTFELFTKTDKAPDGAWTQGPEDDRDMVAAMVNGNDMVVKGVSARGTETVDTYSLSGFTATKKVIDKTCPK